MSHLHFIVTVKAKNLITFLDHPLSQNDVFWSKNNIFYSKMSFWAQYFCYCLGYIRCVTFEHLCIYFTHSNVRYTTPRCAMLVHEHANKYV